MLNKGGQALALLSFSFFFSVLFTPLSVLLSHRVGAIDVPDGDRKLHARPTPRLGGFAVFFSIFLAGLLFLEEGSTRAALLSGGALLCVLGISDDVFSLSPPLKLFCQAVISLVPVCFSLYPQTFVLGVFSFSLPPWVCIIFSVLWIIMLSNAYNLVDGADMLSSSQALVSAAALSLYVPIAWVLFGSVLGFLPYNRRALGLAPVERMPTRTFLGDTGALFIGYALGVLSLSQSTFSFFWLLFFAVPLYELVSSFFRRAVRGKNPFYADRSHLHHRLMDRGFSPALTVFLLFLYALLFSSAGVLLVELFK